MQRTTITEAVKILESSLALFDHAYWISTEVRTKDYCHDLTSTLQKELSELAKLSVEDHYMAYEPITITFKNSNSKIKHFNSHIADWILQTETASALEEELPALLQLLSPAN